MSIIVDFGANVLPNSIVVVLGVDALADLEVHVETLPFIRGPKGDPGSGVNFVLGEVPTGLIDGINPVFYTAFDIEDGKIEVMLNGLTLKVTEDYNLTGPNQIKFLYSPAIDDILLVNYFKR